MTDRLSPPDDRPKCVIGEYCSRHGFIHGAEAEELRQRLEEWIMEHSGKGRAREIQIILDDVDARDSVAWLEFKDEAKP